MTHRWLSKLGLVSAAFTASVALAPTRVVAQVQPAPSSGDRPTIVVFLADDLSVLDATPYGNKEIPSPAMAQLSKDGMTFDRAYVSSPSCAPSRAGLLTGRYGIGTGAMFNHQLPRADVKKWPAYFQAMGYEVAAIGKVAHYVQVTEYGFDHAAFYKYHEDQCVDEAVKWMAARKTSATQKPLCLFVGTNWPHVPWPKESSFKPGDVSPPAKNADTPRTRQARAKYGEAVKYADRDLGKIRAAVAEHLPADTMFVFSADHGSQFPFAKWNLYEAGVRAPLIVAWPGRVAAGVRTSAMVSWIDVLPTLLEAAGADPKKAAPDIDGRSFLPVLAGKADAHRTEIVASHSGDGRFNFFPARSIRVGDWKYIRNLDPSLEFHSHVDLADRDTGYFASWVRLAKEDPKIAAIVQKYHHRPAEELYDLSKDADEETNLATDAAHAEELSKMRAALDAWMAAHGDKGIESDQAVRPPEPTAPSKDE